MRRFFKWLFVGALTLFGVLILWLMASFAFPPTYKAVTGLPGTKAQLIMTLQPSHPFLAEYDRTMILRDAKGGEVSQVLSNDTGGYSRAQLYALPGGEFIIKGYFDIASISTEKRRISTGNVSVPSQAKYLGAFDDDSAHIWRFMNAIESPELPLVASGG